MKKLILKKLIIKNFKGTAELTVDFGQSTTWISGKNASGKTTVLDALWWLMFGKDSHDREKFEIRTLDAGGKKIHHTEISVTGEFEVDGQEITFSKTQKENWVKKRGSENPTLQGNINEYEINGYPMSDAEYKEKVSDMISEDMFKILTNPAHFPSMPWKDQRKVLMGMISNQNDYDLAKSYGQEYEILLKEFDFAKPDDVAKKYNKIKKELSEKQVEIPIRIDELSNTKTDCDIQELESKESEIESRLATINGQIDSNGADTEELQSRLKELMKKKSKIEVDADSEKIKHIAELNAHVSMLESDIHRAEHDLSTAKSSIDQREEEKKTLISTAWEYKDKYEEAIKEEFPDHLWQFNENDTICKLCGQKLPNDKISELKEDFARKKEKAISDFENEKSMKVESIKRNVERCTERIKHIDVELDALRKQIKVYEEELSDLGNELKDSKEKVAKYESLSPSLDENKEYTDVLAEINKVEAELDKTSEDDHKASLIDERDRLMDTLNEIVSEIALASKNKDVDARIEELREELQDVSQKISDAEHILFILDKYVKRKMSEISGTINAKFDVVGFKLFSEQLNGGIKECCEMTVNGVPYASLNSGHRIIGGLDIIHALQGLYEISIPTFIDNAETVNEYNLPKMDNQLVLLKVTDSDLEISKEG